jgi:Caspase domain
VRPGGLSRRQVLRLAAAGIGLAGAGLRAQAADAPAVALLVGNTSYNPNDDDLPPARKCLVDLEAELRRLGYATRVLHDPPAAQVLDALDAMRHAVAADARTAAVFYFVGHGFQSNAENFLIPAGGDLESRPAELARRSLCVERDVFRRLERPAGAAATVILFDACRTLERPHPDDGHNQTMPPDGCHVAFATGPGQPAFAPADPQRHTFFAEALVTELAATTPSRSVLATLEGVQVKVARTVNSIDSITRAFGENAQRPELASNVLGDPSWILVDAREAARPADEASEIERMRQEDRARAERAARIAGLDLDIAAFAAGRPPRVAEDAKRAAQGDKYAALRVAETLPLPRAGELIERTDYGRWMAFAAWMGNGIAAYRLSLYFRNVDHRDAEAARYLRLAHANHYTPPRQLDPSR